MKNDLGSSYDALRVPLVAVRTPLLPVDVVLSVFAADDVKAALRQTLASKTIARLAIRVASPSLSRALDEWIAHTDPSDGAVFYRCMAYLSRMSTRPTPFGIFAGIGMADVGEATTLELDSERRTTRTRADMELLSECIKVLEKGANRGKISYVANEAVFARGGRLYVPNIRLTSFGPTSAAQRPVTLRLTDAVRYVLDLSHRPIRYDEICAQLATRFGAAAEEASKVVEALIDSGVLISELQASPIGDSIQYLFDRFSEIDEALAPILQRIALLGTSLDKVPVNERSLEAYNPMIEACTSLVSESPKTLIQTDMHAPLVGALGENVLRDAARLGDLLVRMGGTQTLSEFRKRFLKKYDGHERMVPLLELVDSNLGLGNPDDPEVRETPNPERDSLLISLACDALRSQVDEIDLTLEQLAIVAPPLSREVEISNLEVGFQIAASSHEAIDNGEYLVVPSGFFGRAGSARSLGRFMHLLGPEVQRRAALLANEGGDNSIRAEFVYMPSHGRSYNVFVRPRLLDTEIQVGVVDAEPTDRIDLNDLWVGLDGDRFFLWSASRRRAVSPIESHVFNTSRFTPNVCRLISFIASDGTRTIGGFPWGAAAAMTSLPRIKIGRIVLSARQWLFRADEFGSSSESATAALEKFRKEWRLPRWVYLNESDNRLFLDLESSIAGSLLYDQIGADARFVKLQEALPGPGDIWLRDSAGDAYISEFIASLTVATQRDDVRKSRIPTHLVPSQKHGPGSSWIYAKVYVGSQAIEDFLLRSIKPLVHKWREAGMLDRWFFVRYADPDSHVRVRFRACFGFANRVREEFVEAAERLLTDASISTYSLNTYEPEYERYGGEDGMTATEAFFTADSDLCLSRFDRSGRSMDARVALAAEMFYPWLHGRQELLKLALDAFEEYGRHKLSKADRESARRLASSAVEPATSELADALDGSEKRERILSLFHMHCNRLGVDPLSERRAAAVLRSLVLAKRSRDPYRDSN
ncbi:MAG TPA: lantibiotic dehydratase [Candidatus Acidoferrales bacterium]|jgi:thiopeptide-type bacteriocin biosynthesis protein|nr:lantibiotic dehydratase [Candidatus Acidoferrales bacterium]